MLVTRWEDFLEIFPLNDCKNFFVTEKRLGAIPPYL